MKVARRSNDIVNVGQTKTCIYWLKGRCNRNPCRFLHSLQSTHDTVKTPPYNPNTYVRNRHFACPVSNPNRYDNSKRVYTRNTRDETPLVTKNSQKVYTKKSTDEASFVTKASQKVYTKDEAPLVTENASQKVYTKDETPIVTEASQNVCTKDETPPVTDASQIVYTKDETLLVTEASQVDTRNSTDETLVTEASQKRTICKYWVNDNCVHGDHCPNVHSWFSGDGISTVAKLQGHTKLVTGIALPLGSDKLYSGSSDGTVRTWDCHSGQCTNVANLGAEVTSLITEGDWIFAALDSAVKAWNFQTASLFTLHGPKGQIPAMVTGHGTLLAAAEDGVISAWRCSSDANSPFELVASLTGHTKSVVCLTVGCTKMLYSGSIDQTIKVWDLDTLECTETLTGHTGAVTSLLCWDKFLLSGSSDGTIKIWGRTEDGTLNVMHTHTVEAGVVALCGLTDEEDKPILCCSCIDNSVYLYELPSFSERARLFAKKEVGSIEVGPDRLIFTGDGTGLLTVWKLLEELKVAASS